ncbi:DUF2332 domain-containing protein [Streptomyces sp. TRM 70351]|uniref:DUF2332 domain-containing protein n=1 Tax=Streptomyces sp. TRM 70351 TaxID=3116552 RepID=UPI002E7B6561|nr:DUF2332 domain-containing protein [Streptomyces sp. TRM 70351]MEE1926980.1 DUF2332 domain-containing protein [Streptomyces sp. TRM 70351]
MTREHAAAMVAHQGAACAELGSPLYAALLARAAADIRAGGPCADAVAGHEDAPGPYALGLRLAGGVHALVLSGRAPALARCYPSAGGTFDPSRPQEAWRAFADTVAAELPFVRAWLTRPPQTNEVGRAGLLVAGMLWALDRAPLPVRLFEVGASAGLNLRADHFRCTGEGFASGPRDSAVRLANVWRGTPPRWLTGAAARHPGPAVVERRGCDVDPVDPASPAGALALRAYLWPDQEARHARLAGALRLAARVPAEVTAAGAADFLAGLSLEEGTLTVVWHSVMRQYVPAPEWARAEAELERLAASATPRRAFVHLAFEPCRAGRERPFRLTARFGGGEPVVLADAAPHGLPAYAPAPA